MACNGMPSSFFPPNFLYQMQQPPMDGGLPALPEDLRGVAAAMLGKRPSLSLEEMGAEDEFSDDCSQAGEKKRRLNLEQVRTLERNFELGNKLEPERKMQLARALGLQPRQVAIWFQNRRARWKTKKLEKDYEGLKGQFDAAREENEALHEENRKLQAELLALKGRSEATEPTINLNKETEGSSSNRTENNNSSDINLQAIDSPPDPNQGIAFFPSYKQQAMSQLHCQIKPEHGAVGGGQEENLCSIFSGMDEQSAFWAWSTEQQHNFH